MKDIYGHFVLQMPGDVVVYDNDSFIENFPTAKQIRNRKTVEISDEDKKTLEEILAAIMSIKDASYIRWKSSLSVPVYKFLISKGYEIHSFRGKNGVIISWNGGVSCDA